MVCGAERRTWSELRANVDGLAATLRTRFEPDTVVSVLGGTSIDYVEAVIAVLDAGLIALPLDVRYPVSELSRALELGEPAAVVAADAAGVGLGAQLTPPVIELDSLRTGDPAPTGDSPTPAADTPALLLFTSGTAGNPRLAMLSRANMAASINQTIAHSPHLAEPTQVLLGVMPLSHVLGLVSVVGVALAAGATLVLAPDPSVAAVVDAVQTHRVRVLVAPPVFWFRLAEGGPDPVRLASVELLISGAAPLSGSLAKRVHELVGVPMRQGYGLTEASPALTSSAGLDVPPTSVGRPLPGVEMRLVDDYGDDALVGDVGEVWARGANIFLGYWRDPDATAAVLDADGWLRTGDLGVVDESGCLYIVGRSKDQIIVAGFNVHPGEVEERIVEHPGVEAAAVIGEPDREYGEVVVAHIVAGAQRPTIEDLQAHCRVRLAGYKVPSRWVFVDELPQGFNGKLRRRSLRSN